MSALRIIALIFGVVFIVIGVLGFMPNFVQNGNLLLGYFQIDSMHNGIHIVSGIIALLAMLRESYAKLYFQIFGIIYAIVAVIGFWQAGNLYFMQVNMADNVLHAVIALIALFFGFVFQSRTE